MDAVEDIKSRLSIEDVVGEYVQLKRSGSNYKGLSPFTSERSPSFMVSPEKQIWHDFSSSRGGDMFSFVMEMEGLDFKQTLELLARKAGVDLEQYRGSRQGSNAKQKERLYDALEQAAKFYQVQFSKNKLAYEYILGKRQFSKETALEWRLGYSPDGGTALIDYLRTKKFTDDEIKEAGLSAKRYRGMGDMFRGRVMVPLQDPQGRVIGFTARLLKDDPNAPKYINTPQTMLYDKSRHVYGLHLAKDAIRRSKFVVLVEGNLDVIASHQAGVRQVVATAGTALTEPNLKTLSRFTGDIRLSFDADKAGIAATERAIPIASKVGVSLSIITIPSGKDPDELIRQSATTWQTVIGQPQYALDWLIERYQGLLDIKSVQGKKELSDVLLPVIRRLNDSVEQDHYMTQLAALLGVSRDAVDKKLDKQPEAPKAERKQVPTPARLTTRNKEQVDYLKTQDHVLALLLLHPSLRAHANLLTDHMFSTGKARHLLNYLMQHQEFRASLHGFSQELDVLTAGLPPEQVQILQDYAKILVLQHEELYGDVESLELDYEVTRLQARLIEQYIKYEKQNLTRKLSTADEPTVRQILTQVKELDELRNQANRIPEGGRNDR
jgi:DNA primase